MSRSGAAIKKHRPKSCKVCGQAFTPQYNTTQRTCGAECALTASRDHQKKKLKRMERDLEKAQRAKDRKWRQDNKPMTKVMADLQRDVNQYIRERDRGKPCISCGRTERDVETSDLPQVGGWWDAGHYHSRGARPECRYLLTNIWRQCKACNSGQKYRPRLGITTQQAYRENLVGLIGEEAVERLDGPHTHLKPTREWAYRYAKLIRKRARYYKRRRDCGIYGR